jgi:hypothetical protein
MSVAAPAAFVHSNVHKGEYCDKYTYSYVPAN